MTDYKHATAWLDCLSKSPPQEHGGFDPDTIEGATVSLREILRLKRENAMMRRWIKVFIYRENGDDATYVSEWKDRLLDEIRAAIPDLFKAKRRGSK